MPYALCQSLRPVSAACASISRMALINGMGFRVWGDRNTLASPVPWRLIPPCTPWPVFKGEGLELRVEG